MKSLSSAARGFWGLAWRSAVLLPVTAAYLVLLCAAYVCVFLLPLAALVLVWDSERLLAAACAAAWPPLFLFLRWWWRRERAGIDWGVL